ncbi:MAG: hypothetical protein VB853_13055 [Pirellulales bacterium]
MATFTQLATIGRGDDQMVAARANLLAEGQFLRVATEVRIERDGDEMLVDVVRFYLSPGEPPGAIRSTCASRTAQRAAVRRRENDQRLVLGNRAAAGFGDICHPRHFSPWTFAGLRLDCVVQLIEVFGRDRAHACFGGDPRGPDKNRGKSEQT